MKKFIASTLFLLLVMASFVFAETPEEMYRKVVWQNGPAKADIGEIAEITVPNGYKFTDASGSKIMMELCKNPLSGTELGYLTPNDENWYILFEFDPDGYVKDDEKSELDADAMLKSLIKGNDESNKERKEKGWPAIEVVGWETKPNYNEKTHNLEWAIRVQDTEGQIINFNTRILGRTGVMRVTLVGAPESMTSTIPIYQSLMGGYAYKSGYKYEEFTKGDKIAEYGLSALVVGGATAVAAKAGLFKWLWKIGVVAFIGIAAFFRKMFSGKASA